MTNTKAKKFLSIAKAIAQEFSKYNTKVGCVIVGPNNEVLSIGYNGAPRGCSADEDWRRERPESLFWAAHAELNALTNAARVGTPLEGGTLVVTHMPCMDCARAIVQAGIKEVHCPVPEADFADRWHTHIERTERLFKECGVELHHV